MEKKQGLKQTQRALMAVYIGMMSFAIIWVGLCELTTPNFIGLLQKETEMFFICKTVLVISTLALIPLALRLFKFRKIHEELINDTTPNHAKLLVYGMLRMDMLHFPMIINILLYYFFMEPGFGYMAIVMFLSSLFIVPTMKRCEAEVTESEA